MPLSLSTGRPGPAARAALAEVDAWPSGPPPLDPPVTVETHDERLTTVTAQRSLATGGVRARPAPALVDQVAAAVMLQSWLDGRRAGAMTDVPNPEVPRPSVRQVQAGGRQVG